MSDVLTFCKQTTETESLYITETWKELDSMFLNEK